jgi:hypothetical protein
MGGGGEWDVGGVNLLCVVMCIVDGEGLLVAIAISRYLRQNASTLKLLDICVTNNGYKLCPSYKLITWTIIDQVQVSNLDDYYPSLFLQYVFHKFLCGHRPSY